MERYIVDANLPYYFSLWKNDAYQHVIDINPEMKDSEIWNYAQNNNLTIITKDADFSDLILFNDPHSKGYSYQAWKYENESIS